MSEEETKELHYVLDHNHHYTVAPGDRDAAKQANLPETFARDRQAEMETGARTQGYTLVCDDSITMHEEVQ